jgi:hypothetical protein
MLTIYLTLLRSFRSIFSDHTFTINVQKCSHFISLLIHCMVSLLNFQSKEQVASHYGLSWHFPDE